MSLHDGIVKTFNILTTPLLYLADLATGASSPEGTSVFSDSKLRKIYTAIYNCMLDTADITCAEARRGRACKIGDYTVFASATVSGYEIGYRLWDTECIVLDKNNNKLFDFWRDGIEIECANSKTCQIASGNWYKDFIQQCATQTPIPLKLYIEPSNRDTPGLYARGNPMKMACETYLALARASKTDKPASPT